MATKTDARQKLVDSLKNLRYSATIMGACPRVDFSQSDEDFLDHVADWLRAFNGCLSDVSNTTTNMAAELLELRNQRKAVRDFLGLTNNTEGVNA